MLLEISYRYESFLQGINNRFIATRPPITHHLSTLYKRFMHENATKETLKILEETIIIRDNILKNAQNGWVSKAEIELNELKLSYAKYSFTEPIMLLMQSQDWPLQAFIEYQKKLLTAAEFSLESGIQADWLLESKYHFKEMQFHRIHLIHNQAKVLLKRHDIAGAIKKILNMMNQIAIPNKIIFTPPIQIESNPISDEYLSLLFYHLSDSLALICRENPKETMLVAKEESKKITTTQDNNYFNSLKNIYSFIENRNIENKSTDQILKSGNIHYAGLWYSAVAILHKYCEENDSPFAANIIQNLSEKKAPAYWIQFVKSV